MHGTSEVEKIPTSINAEVFVFIFFTKTKIPRKIVFAFVSKEHLLNYTKTHYEFFYTKNVINIVI